jgi:hypothetical protein
MRLTVLGLRRGGTWLDREVRYATPIVVAALKQGLTRFGRFAVAASHTGAEIARSLTSELRERTRRFLTAR